MLLWPIAGQNVDRQKSKTEYRERDERDDRVEGEASSHQWVKMSQPYL